MKKKIFTLLVVIFAIAMSANAQINLADFEDGGIIPAYQNESGDDAVSTVSITANPDKGGVNTTNKTLLAETSADKLDAWWGGPRVDFNSAFTVSSSHTYLHILVKTDLPKYEFLILFDTSSESWNGTFNPETTDWFDYVIDLTDVKGQDDLSGKSVKGFRVAVSVNDDGQQDKKLYLDEIIVNDDSNPRTAGTAINHPLSAQKGIIYATSNGIAIEDTTGAVNIYDLSGRSVYKNNATGNLSVPLTSGFYIVSVNGVRQKVLVK
jgi:hypothetical protein